MLRSGALDHVNSTAHHEPVSPARGLVYECVSPEGHSSVSDLSNRRPIKTRAAAWSQRLATALAKAQVSPDLISFTGIAFAVLGGACFALSGVMEGWPRLPLLFVGAACIQLRLLCNMLDGMVAVEHGKGSPAGPIWNELPDRIADTLFLVGAGYGAMAADRGFGPMLGWLCAVLAVICAYVRELGHGLGFPADFSGPLAKPQRMALLTVVAVLSMIDTVWKGEGRTLMAGLGLIAILTAFTVGRRTARLAKALKARSDATSSNA
jgi:phosphatidylglycerophosphate synthase